MNAVTRATGLLLLLSVGAQWVARATDGGRLALVAIFLVSLAFDLFIAHR